MFVDLVFYKIIYLDTKKRRKLLLILATKKLIVNYNKSY